MGIIYTWVLQEGKIFPMFPRSEWSAQWSLTSTCNYSKIWVKNWQQNFLWLHVVTSWQNLPVTMVLSQKILNWKQAHRRANHWSKKIRKGAKWKAKKKKAAWRHRSFLLQKQKMLENAKLVERKTCCHVANASLSGLKLTWILSWCISSQEPIQMTQQCSTAIQRFVKKGEQWTFPLCTGALGHNLYIQAENLQKAQKLC